MARLRRIGVAGFRSFGQSAQTFELPDSIAVLWGGNSQGKTSLAEALEFLFSGQIARRELLASAKDEFAEALRCAHIGDACPTYVEAHVQCADGQVRCLRRTLTQDYQRGSAAGCVSQLSIDGGAVTEPDIQTKLGISLSHPPLVAPVLTQHTLAYIFSASPTERATYFRALLDTQDLEDFRVAVAGLEATIPPPQHDYLDKLKEIEQIGATKTQLARVRKATTEAALTAALGEAIGVLLRTIHIDPTGTVAADVELLAQELEARRARAFPLELFGRSAPVPFPPPSQEQLAAAATFLGERAKMEDETKRLVNLFDAAIHLHPHAIEEAIDCPLCGTADALTPERIQFIELQVRATQGFVAAGEAFEKSLRDFQAQAEATLAGARNTLPRFLRMSASARTKAGFSVARVRELVASDATVDEWLTALMSLMRAVIALQTTCGRLIQACRLALADADRWDADEPLRATVDLVLAREQLLSAAGPAYAEATRQVFEPLKTAVDEGVATGGWEALIDCAKSPPRTLEGLNAAAAYDIVVKSIKAALGDIEKGNGTVADEKFADLSNDVKHWWECLRPDESTFFDGIKRRSAKARRNVDLRVGLTATDDRSDAKFRDAVAVLSQSQLHCLGLSLFLARAVREEVGFIVLDDPVLTSDDDYSPNFASSVIEHLLAKGVQIIVVTQDHDTWKDIGHRWDHRQAAQFQLVRNSVVEGTEIRSQTDDLATMIARAVPFTKSQDPEQRKLGAQRVRLAIERFSKQLLVKSRKANGDNQASITDYNENFGNYSGQVQALLTKDAAHPGKLVAAHNYVTPGAHDAPPPATGKLAVALGDLRKLKKDYLDA